MDSRLDLDIGPLMRLLGALPRNLQKNSYNNAVRAGAKVIADEAKLNAPFNPERKTGVHLRKAIQLKKDKQNRNKFGWVVGTEYKGSKAAPHAHLLEYGTVKMAAQPFLRPAFAAKHAEAEEAIIQKLASEVERFT